MATPKIIADFETQLSTAVAVGATSFSLSSATDDDGNALPAGLYYFTIDNGSTNKEYVAGTLSGTSVTGVLNVSRQGIETSGTTKAHRVGASVIISDFNTYKKYMDEIALVSAPDADTTTKGVVEEATAAEINAGTASGGSGAELFVAPDALLSSNYGTRLPSADEKTFLTNLQSGDSSVQPQIVTFTSSSTWTKDAGLKYVVVEVVGGGGAVDSASATAGGGAGGYSRKLILASTLNATETVTVGAAGSNGTTPTAGGTSSFGSHLSATGGSPVDNASPAYGGAGGTGSSGDINITGGRGGVKVDEGGVDYYGVGGTSYFGGQGAYGSGAGAGATSTAQSAGTGIVIVTEYYS